LIYQTSVRKKHCGRLLMSNFSGKKIIFNTVALSEQVRIALKEEILTGPLAPGQRIDLRASAKLWNVSPTPLRDAIKQLESQGLVEVSPHIQDAVSGVIILAAIVVNKRIDPDRD
jgi:DNA-binding transcriptional MocR family regulator